MREKSSFTHRLRRLLSRARTPLLPFLILVLVNLACFEYHTEITVKHDETKGDTLDIFVIQILTPKYMAVAEILNNERAEDYAKAGRPNVEKLFPETIYEMEGGLFDSNRFYEMGFDVSSTDRAMAARKKISPLKDPVITEDWEVKVLQVAGHPEKTKYQVKVFVDFTDVEGFEEIIELRDQPLPDEKPGLEDLGADVEPSGDVMGTLFSLLDAAKQQAEKEAELDFYYLHKALRQTDPIIYRITVELPGKIKTHELDGKTAGETVGDNFVKLEFNEKDLMANAGKTLVFHVVSILLDCSEACTGVEHLVWDGDTKADSCHCICEKGWFVSETTDEEGNTTYKCHECDGYCKYKNPQFLVDLEKCEPDHCVCKCNPPMKINNAGTECIDEHAAWLEDNQVEENLPSPQALKEAVQVILDPESEKDARKMPGWYFLTRSQKESLVEHLESLGKVVDRTRLSPIPKSDPLPPNHDCHGLGEEGRRLCLEKIRKDNHLKNTREKAIREIEDEIDERRRIQKHIIHEIGGSYETIQKLLEIPGWISKLNGSAKEIAIGLVEDELTSTVKDNIRQQVVGDDPLTIQEAAYKLIKKIPEMATQGCVDDYYQYLTVFEEYCEDPCSGDDAEIAHEIALEKLHNTIDEKRRIWAKKKGAYDRAFRRLNGIVPLPKK